MNFNNYRFAYIQNMAIWFLFPYKLVSVLYFQVQILTSVITEIQSVILNITLWSLNMLL